MTLLSQAYESAFGAAEQTVQAHRPSALRVLVCGAVDDGKSTLIGRLVAEAGGITDDQQIELVEASRLFGTNGPDLDYSLVTDGLEAEREQNITIDVAYRYLATAERDFIIVDTPGHEQFTANMATGASQCDVAVILVDAVRGLSTQTLKHAAICSLLGIRQVVLTVNKMDAVAYDETLFGRIVDQFLTATSHLQLTVTPIPVAARHGINVTTVSPQTPWYRRLSLLDHLATLTVMPAPPTTGLRLTVQGVARMQGGERLYTGSVVAGRITANQTVKIALSDVEVTVSRLFDRNGLTDGSETGEPVAFTLTPEIDLGRGGLVTSGSDGPICTNIFSAYVIWFGRQSLLAGRDYEMRLATATSPVTVTAIRGRFDVATGSHVAATLIDRDEIGICHLATPAKVALDRHANCPPTGRFILIDRVGGDTVAAGLVRHALDRGSNLFTQKLTVDRQARERLLGQKGAVLWFTGLSGSGKSTIADALERKLHAQGKLTLLLDGDNVRLGLNRDLGFTEGDRVENLRRVAEVAKLMVDAGLIILCSFISPVARDRAMVRERLIDCPFFELFVDASIKTCEQRDPKGLYAKARRGEIRHFTGVDSAYEVPAAPDLVLETDCSSADGLADNIIRWLTQRGVLA